MTGNENGTRRAVIILHPDFDEPGKTGVKTAADFARDFTESQKAFVLEASKGKGKEVREVLQKQAGQFIVIVRSLPNDLL